MIKKTCFMLAGLTLAVLLLPATGCSRQNTSASSGKQAWTRSKPPPQYHGPGQPNGPMSGPASAPKPAAAGSGN